jgi:hypothetical protein
MSRLSKGAHACGEATFQRDTRARPRVGLKSASVVAEARMCGRGSEAARSQRNWTIIERSPFEATHLVPGRVPDFADDLG